MCPERNSQTKNHGLSFVVSPLFASAFVPKPSIRTLFYESIDRYNHHLPFFDVDFDRDAKAQ